MKLNYILIPLFALSVAGAGSLVTSRGMEWYKKINLPDFTPPGSFIGTVWTIIFILSAISAIMVWNKALHNQKFWIIIGLFILNGLLNFFWSYLFFGKQQIFGALFEIIPLEVSVVTLMILIWPLSRLASLLLLPYAGWVAFASYLNYLIWTLNK
ncbi:MAG: TspO/MBR family protein [Patescibacteria group bacterium]